MKIVQKGVKDETIKLRPPGIDFEKCPGYYKRNTTYIYNKPIQNLVPTYPAEENYKAVFWFPVGAVIRFKWLATAKLYANVRVDTHFNIF